VVDGAAVGRTHREAPEIDGIVQLERVAGEATPEPGTMVPAVATSALGPDLFARAVAPAHGAR